jgi:hypothetical protein
MRWKKQPNSCQRLDTLGNIWPKLIKRLVAGLTRNTLLPVRKNWGTRKRPDQPC